MIHEEVALGISDGQKLGIDCTDGVIMLGGERIDKLVVIKALVVFIDFGSMGVD